MSVTDGNGQTPCSLEHYLVIYVFISDAVERLTRDVNWHPTRGLAHYCV